MIDDHDLDLFSMNSSTTRTDMGSDIIRYPGPNDVLFGRGGAINQHVGNIMFREIVNEQKDDYFKAPKCEKPKIARRVIDIVRNLHPPGRFLAPLYDADRNCKDVEGRILWRDVGDKKARAKASQCLREKKIHVPNKASSKKSSEPKKRKKLNPKAHQKSYSSSSNSGGIHLLSNQIDFPDEQDKQISSSGPAVNRQQPSKAAKCASSNEGQHTSDWWLQQYHRQHNESGQLGYHDRQKVVQAVTPCYDSYKRPKIYHSPTTKPTSDEYSYHQQRQQEKLGVGSEDSWIGSFCSVETKLIEEGEKASLSPRFAQMPSIIPSSVDRTLPVVLSTTSWAESDVGSELTDNSHVENF